MSDPMTQIQEQINGLKNDLENLRGETVGDRNHIEAYKKTQRGRIEILEETVKELVTQEQHKELDNKFVALDGSVNKLSKVIAGFTNAFNRGITIILGAILSGFGLWLFNRITGGP